MESEIFNVLVVIEEQTSTVSIAKRAYTCTCQNIVIRYWYNLFSIASNKKHIHIDLDINVEEIWENLR